MVSTARVDLKVGFACNNHCVFCAQGDKRSRCDALSTEELVRRLAQGRSKARGLVLTGGEPTLYRRLAVLVRAARALGFTSIQLQTNGRLLRYPELVDGLLEAGVTEFSPSLHGSTASIHDELTRAEGSFEDSSEGIREVASRGLPLMTNSVITRSNAHDLPALVELLASLGVRRAQLAFVHPVGTAAQLFDEVVPRLPAVVEPLRRAREVASSHGMSLFTEAVPLCFLRGMRELAVEPIIPHTTVVDVGAAPLDYEQWRESEGKAHGPPCQGCAERASCEGPWREYPERFGWGEFEPVTGEGA